MQVIGDITDLKVKDVENSADVQFSFTAPKIVGVPDAPEKYRFYRSSSEEALQKLNLDEPTLPEGVTNAFEADSTVYPGNMFSVTQKVPRDSMFYYAAAAFNGTEHVRILQFEYTAEL